MRIAACDVTRVFNPCKPLRSVGDSSRAQSAFSRFSLESIRRTRSRRRWHGLKTHVTCQRIIAFALITVITAGCAVGPDYQRPQMKLPPAWSTTQPASPQASVARWWMNFDDPQLSGLIAIAVSSSPDMRLVQARIREARANSGAAASGLFPSVDANGNITRSRSSENLFDFNPGSTGGGVPPGTGGVFSPPGTTSTFYQAGFDASWEIDVFGGVRRGMEAADADLSAAVEDARDVWITLAAEVARAYMELRGAQRRLDIARRNIVSQQDTVDLTQTRFDAGIVGELDVAQARAQIARTQAAVPVLEVEVRRHIHRLSVLLGQPPTTLLASLSRPAPIPSMIDGLPAGLPSELLRRRPDVRRAERQLAASTARVGVAVAELFPKFSLTGAFGLQSTGSDEFFDSGSRFWSFGPSVRWPIFQGGRLRAEIAAADARREQALVTYEKTVLTSLEDVENALVAFEKEQVRLKSLEQAVTANRRAMSLASELYDKGLGSFLNVLDTRRSLLESEDQAAQSQRDVAVQAVSLYKALGGGWEGK